MREKLNSNPMAQVGLVLVLLVVVGFMFLKGMGGEEEGEEAVPAEAPAAVEAEAPVEGVASTPAASVTAPLPAPPLPKDVTAAYQSGQTVVLLVVRDGGIDDELARDSVQALSSVPDAAVFIVPVKEVARYAAITLGVDLNRVPALVVMRPKALSEAGPEAAVTYGFQTAQSVEQAVRDARYDGPTVSYHPE
ncbi:MAG TPA: hypothetical protein VK889_02745 [Solirubrobacterales bacterium]|nr:hypothetical protein [Solirubrobacterales bacterium]